MQLSKKNAASYKGKKEKEKKWVYIPIKCFLRNVRIVYKDSTWKEHRCLGKIFDKYVIVHSIISQYITLK